MAASNQKQKDAVFLGDGKTAKNPHFSGRETAIFYASCGMMYAYAYNFISKSLYLVVPSSKKCAANGLRRLKTSACHPLGTAGEEGAASGHVLPIFPACCSTSAAHAVAPMVLAAVLTWHQGLQSTENLEPLPRVLQNPIASCEIRL